jgi:hypothetical protein
LGVKSFSFDSLLEFKQWQAHGQDSLSQLAEKMKNEENNKVKKEEDQVPTRTYLTENLSEPKRPDHVPDVVVEQEISPFRKARDQAERAARLYRQHDPANVSILIAMVLVHVADGCDQPLTSTIKSTRDCLSQPDVMNELTRLIKLCPDNAFLHYYLLEQKYLVVFHRLLEEKKVAPDDQYNPNVPLKSLCKKEEWQELESSLQLKNRIKEFTPEKAILGHHALSLMALRIGDWSLAIQHARQLCDLAPEAWENWNLLVTVMCVSGHAADLLALKDKWLKYHPTAETHFLLAKAAEKSGDWKLVSSHVVEGLKLDPTHVTLLYSQVVADLKNDSSPAALKIADDRLKKMKPIVEKTSEPQKLTSFEDCYVTHIVVSTLTGDLGTAHQGLDACLYRYPQNSNFPKLRQILGVAGLQPPTLGKP